MLQVVRVVSENARPCMYACGCQWKQGGSGGGSTETTGAERHPSGVTHSSCMTSIWLWHTQAAWHPFGFDTLKLHGIHLAWHPQAAWIHLAWYAQVDWHSSGLTLPSCMTSIWLDTLKLHGICLAWHAQVDWHPSGLTLSSRMAEPHRQDGTNRWLDRQGGIHCSEHPVYNIIRGNTSHKVARWEHMCGFWLCLLLKLWPS